MTLRGTFIVFEGIEGSGKSTQAGMLAEWLSSLGIPHVLAREPGGTQVGESVRALVLHGSNVSPRTELMLYLAARAELVAERIRPALDAGLVVVADRYELSTLAYQGYGRGIPLEEVVAANRVATGGLQPDLTIVVRVPEAVGLARLAGRGEADRIEREAEAFHRRVAQAYDTLTETEPAVEAVDGVASPDLVHLRVVRLLQGRFSETFAEKRV